MAGKMKMSYGSKGKKTYGAKKGGSGGGGKGKKLGASTKYGAMYGAKKG